MRIVNTQQHLVVNTIAIRDLFVSKLHIRDAGVSNTLKRKGTIIFRGIHEKDTIFFSEPEQSWRETYNKRVRFIFRSTNPKGYDYSTRYDYSAFAGIEMPTARSLVYLDSLIHRNRALWWGVGVVELCVLGGCAVCMWWSNTWIIWVHRGLSSKMLCDRIRVSLIITNLRVVIERLPL